MIINCTLEKVDVNPPQVKYTWYSCGTSKCNEKNAKLKSDSYSLELDSQSKSPMNYRCKAENAAGSDYQDIEVIGQSESESKIIRRITTARILYTHIWQYSKTFFYMPISINDDCHNDLEICGGGGGGGRFNLSYSHRYSKSIQFSFTSFWHLVSLIRIN